MLHEAIKKEGQAGIPYRNFWIVPFTGLKHKNTFMTVTQVFWKSFALEPSKQVNRSVSE